MLPIAIMGIIAFFLMTSYSGFVWDNIYALQKVQFPWRLQSVSSLFLAISIGGLLKLTLSLKSHYLKVLLSIFLFGFVVINSYLYFSLAQNADAPRHPGNKYALKPNMSYEEMGQNFFWFYMQDDSTLLLLDSGGFKPVWATHNLEVLMNMIKTMEKTNKYAFFHRGAGTIEIASWKPEDRLLNINVFERGVLLLRTFYYPNWKAYANGIPIKIYPDPDSGAISINLPEGSCKLSLKFEKGNPYMFGLCISLTALFAELALSVIGIKLFLKGSD